MCFNRRLNRFADRLNLSGHGGVQDDPKVQRLSDREGGAHLWRPEGPWGGADEGTGW